MWDMGASWADLTISWKQILVGHWENLQRGEFTLTFLWMVGDNHFITHAQLWRELYRHSTMLIYHSSYICTLGNHSGDNYKSRTILLSHLTVWKAVALDAFDPWPSVWPRVYSKHAEMIGLSLYKPSDPNRKKLIASLAHPIFKNPI